MLWNWAGSKEEYPEERLMDDEEEEEEHVEDIKLTGARAF
jgi:hypothetical protein